MLMPQSYQAKPYRYSRQRERLLEVLRASTLHPTASWLYDQLKSEFPKLSFGTIYRNLTILIEQGLVQKIDAGSTFDRFEAKTIPHYHLICTQCGSICDVEQQLFPDIDETITNMTGFVVEKHRIDFLGMCIGCCSKIKNTV